MQQSEAGQRPVPGSLIKPGQGKVWSAFMDAFTSDENNENMANGVGGNKLSTPKHSFNNAAGTPTRKKMWTMDNSPSKRTSPFRPRSKTPTGRRSKTPVTTPTSKVPLQKNGSKLERLRQVKSAGGGTKRLRRRSEGRKSFDLSEVCNLGV
jgi:hypothetical protein